MARMASASLAFLITVGFGATLVDIADAHGFLKANPALREQRLSTEDVQTSLLAEVEGIFGEGTTSSRVQQFESALTPIYAALPKNEYGYLGHATVRYALHRLFVQRHGWFVKGLDTRGAHRESNSSATVLKEQVPAYLQDLFEKRLSGRGFGPREVAVLAATIEHLVHSETAKRMGAIFKVFGYPLTSSMSKHDAEELLETYMSAYVLGEDISRFSRAQALYMKGAMDEVYMSWNQTRGFVHAVHHNVTVSESSEAQKASGDRDFSLIARVAERVGEQFGSFQDAECGQMKSDLLAMEEPGATGRVRLSDFYKPALDGNWQFQDSVAYLRQVGALDESDVNKPRVLIANYLSSLANCIASSSFYSVCCMDECEGLLGHLEIQIAAPEATSTHIAKLVSQLPSSSVAAPRQLSPVLLERLAAIATEHGGTVPLHGRLFSQWMHHAYPRECPYPHVAATIAPQTHAEWLARTGGDHSATDEEMRDHVDNVNMTDIEELPTLPWSPEEELLVVRQPQMELSVGNTLTSSMRNVVLFVAMLSLAYGLVKKLPGATEGDSGPQKYMV